MIRGLRNTKYFLSEVKTIIKLNGISSFLSMISLALIFFITAITLSGWWISTVFTQALENEAEISVYYPKLLTEASVQALVFDIENIKGVKEVTLISAEESYNKMSEILGQEAIILSQFDENPFEAYLELSINIEALDSIIFDLNENNQIEYVRDNRSILEKINRISGFVALLGIIMTIAVGVSTFIITSHIIREGVHAHENQINTLQLLGAPDGFINLPFIIEGIVLTLISGLIASLAYIGFAVQMGQFAQEIMPLFPSIDTSEIVMTIALSTIVMSLFLGLIASLFGLKLVKTK